MKNQLWACDTVLLLLFFPCDVIDVWFGLFLQMSSEAKLQKQAMAAAAVPANGDELIAHTLSLIGERVGS